MCDALKVGEGGFVTCQDSGGLPTMAGIVVSPDDNPEGSNLVKKILAAGDEICVSSNSNALPVKLFVFVESNV